MPTMLNVDETKSNLSGVLAEVENKSVVGSQRRCSRNRLLRLPRRQFVRRSRLAPPGERAHLLFPREHAREVGRVREADALGDLGERRLLDPEPLSPVGEHGEYYTKLLDNMGKDVKRFDAILGRPGEPGATPARRAGLTGLVRSGRPRGTRP